jgi:hypothetical protein
MSDGKYFLTGKIKSDITYYQRIMIIIQIVDFKINSV